MFVTIISFIIVLGVLIFFHEFGHYITAKKVGVRVEEFALGFGPKILSRQKGETVYSIRSVPLGGFCNMTGEFLPDEEMSEEEKETYLAAKEKGKCFHQKSIWQRFLVIFMGPFMNFLLAALIFILIFAIYGLPVDSSKSTVIGQVNPEQPAAGAGLKAGDKVIAIDNENVDNWNEMASIIHKSKNKSIVIKFERDNKIQKISVTPKYDENAGYPIVGIYPKLIRKKVGLFKSIRLGLIQTWDIFYYTIAGFIQMISQRSTADLGGPVMIASIIGQAAKIGLSNLLNWMAIISINLGIINLLPFPALDGGRIVFIVVEFFRGKPVAPEKEGFVHFIGFVLLMILMVFILYKDIMRSLF